MESLMAKHSLTIILYEEYIAIIQATLTKQ